MVVYADMSINCRGLKIGISSNCCNTSRSLSPDMMMSHFPATAAARILSSSASRLTGAARLAGITISIRDRNKCTASSEVSAVYLNFLTKFSLSSSSMNSETISSWFTKQLSISSWQTPRAIIDAISTLVSDSILTTRSQRLLRRYRAWPNQPASSSEAA